MDSSEVHGQKFCMRSKETAKIVRWYKQIGTKDFIVANISEGSGGGESSKNNFGYGYLLPMVDISEKEAFVAFCTVEFIPLNDRSYYPACFTCNKKVEQGLDEKFECIKCDRKYDQPNYKYLVTVKLSDGCVNGVKYMK